MPAPAPRLDAAALEEFLRADFPQTDASVFRVEDVTPTAVRARFHAAERHLRPGGTVSGPARMTLGDTAMYLAVPAMTGPVAQAATTSLDIHFLRRPPPGDLVADARLVKLGRSLAVGEVTIHGRTAEESFALATVTCPFPREAPETMR